jgi:hypothetical protein
MVALVTLDRVKMALRIGAIDEASGGGFTVLAHEDDAILTELYIPAASAAVIDHLKSQAEVLLDLDSGGDMPSGAEVPEAIQMATILLIGSWYDNPREDFGDNELPAPVKAILRPLRDPALA